MAKWISLLFEPLSIPVYKWQGEFSPQFRGPQAYAESRPIPLPSTIAGLLAGQLSNGGCGDVEGILAMQLGDAFRLRGPYIYIEGSSINDNNKKTRILCMILGDSNLYCINADNPTHGVGIETRALQHVGIALDSLSRIVIEGYIYTIRAVGLYTTLIELTGLNKNEKIKKSFDVRSIENLGILVEVGSNNDAVLKFLDGEVVWMGSRQKPYRVKVLEEAPARRVASKTPRDQVLLHVVSPILLCEDKKIKYDIGPDIEVNLYNDLLEKIGAQPLREGPGRICGRLIFTSIGRGYDLCSNNKRQYCQAVMPGIQLKAILGSNPLVFYEEGAGSYNRLGWGTILPLPLSLWACRKKKEECWISI